MGIRKFLVLLSLVMTIVATIYNFAIIFTGHTNINNFLISCIVIIIWVLLALFSRKSFNCLMYLFLYWGLIFVSISFVLLAPVIEHIFAASGLSIGMLFIPPFLGLIFLLDSLAFYVILLLIALVFIVYCILCLIINNKNPNQKLDKELGKTSSTIENKK